MICVGSFTALGRQLTGRSASRTATVPLTQLAGRGERERAEQSEEAPLIPVFASRILPPCDIFQLCLAELIIWNAIADYVGRGQTHIGKLLVRVSAADASLESLLAAVALSPAAKLLIIKTENQEVCGAYIAAKNERAPNRPAGRNAVFLFCVHPRLSIVKQQSQNAEAPVRVEKNKTLTFGGSSSGSGFRLRLNARAGSVEAMRLCETFERGDLLSFSRRSAYKASKIALAELWEL